VLWEALQNGPAPKGVETKSLVSAAVNGVRMILFYQEFDNERYAQTACMLPADARVADQVACRR
jgi:hypothetical protein